MEKIFRIILAAGMGLLITYISLQSLSPSKSTNLAIDLPEIVNTPINAVLKEPAAEIYDLPLQDNLDIYKYDDPGSVVTMYATVRKGNSADNTDYSWKEVNSFSKWFFTNNRTVQVGSAEAIVQIGDENGPLPGELGYGAILPNATIQIRGGSTSLRTQKSYKIELDRNAGEWRGQRTIALNKHVGDPSRVRNKLNYDLMKQIPNMVSLRTQFVHLYVKDQTVDPWETAFVDYGLFTQVELPNKTFLRSHFLDPDGQLYKTTFFEFFRYPDQIRLAEDPLFDEESFSSKLEIKGNRDNSKLIQMLDDLNNFEIPIEMTFNNYFDADNYFTWLAYNILVGSVDTQSQNFYLYSPHNSKKFYFIPWDYDDSFFRRDRVSCCGYAPYDGFEYGVSNYWGSQLANRVLRNAAYRRRLDDKIKELMSFLTPERIQGMLDVYRPVAERYALQMPDLKYFPTTKDKMAQDFEIIPSEVQNNYELYLKSLKTPVPFFLGTPKVKGGLLGFNWAESYDFNKEDISYHFMVSTDWEFKSVIYETTITNLTGVHVGILEPGTYYWGVSATNQSGNTQYAFDSYVDPNSIIHYGVKSFTIAPNGDVLEK
jgi:spore coat protein H